MFAFRFLLLIIFIVIPGVSRAAKENIPLSFQADKNNIQVLPQRFEYNLGDEDNIKIGDITITSTTFGFQIAPSINFPGKFRARFIWPAGLVREGSLLLKDNVGKAIWTTNFNRKTIHIFTPPMTAQEKEAQEKGVRTQLAELLVDELSPDLVEDMKYFPFMNFCISQINQDTRIYLCSKELYLVSQDNRLMIKSRTQGKRTPFVEINGKSVGTQGIIFLNDENENIGFRAMTQTGAILEVETRMKPVDFKDVVINEEKKELILTASGTEPVNEEKVKRLSDGDWQISLPVSRPILYLKGAGNLPMRQEFYIKGNVPVDVARPTLDKGSFDRIYKPEMDLLGTAALETSISSVVPNERLEKLSGNRFRWHLSEIPAGETTRHFLRVNYKDDSFLAGYDIYRDFPFEAGLLGSYWTPAGLFYTDFYLNWWIENFLGRSSSGYRVQWGVNFKESLALTKKDGEANISLTHVELLWRATPGFHFQDKTWGLSFPYEIISGSGINLSSFGLGAFYSDRAKKRYLRYFHWYDLKLNYLLGGSGSGLTLSNALIFQGMAYYHINKRLSWNYGLGLNQYTFDAGAAEMQFQLMGGIVYRF